MWMKLMEKKFDAEENCEGKAVWISEYDRYCSGAVMLKINFLTFQALWSVLKTLPTDYHYVGHAARCL